MNSFCLNFLCLIPGDQMTMVQIGLNPKILESKLDQCPNYWSPNNHSLNGTEARIPFVWMGLKSKFLLNHHLFTDWSPNTLSTNPWSTNNPVVWIRQNTEKTDVQKTNVRITEAWMTIVWMVLESEFLLSNPYRANNNNTNQTELWKDWSPNKTNVRITKD